MSELRGADHGRREAPQPHPPRGAEHRDLRGLASGLGPRWHGGGCEPSEGPVREVRAKEAVVGRMVITLMRVAPSTYLDIKRRLEDLVLVFGEVGFVPEPSEEVQDPLPRGRSS